MADMGTKTHDLQVAGLVARLAGLLEARGWRLATAESCTGGLVAGACTERAGSSVWFERGVVSYSNAAKTSLLGVPAKLILAEGAVSEPVARAMALGAQAGPPGEHPMAALAGTGPGGDVLPVDTSRAGAVEVAVSITGVAGPGGGSVAKPVGTVCFGWALPGRCWTERCWFDGDRAAVRRQSVVHVLGRLVDALEAPGGSTTDSPHRTPLPDTSPDEHAARGTAATPGARSTATRPGAAT
ncbi:MAG: hypothetical protein RL375_1862 [Pseudomonadota bacterium]